MATLAAEHLARFRHCPEAGLPPRRLTIPLPTHPRRLFRRGSVRRQKRLPPGTRWSTSTRQRPNGLLVIRGGPLTAMVRQSGEARLPAATCRPHHICHCAAIGSTKLGSLFLTLPMFPPFRTTCENIPNKGDVAPASKEVHRWQSAKFSKRFMFASFNRSHPSTVYRSSITSQLYGSQNNPPKLWITLLKKADVLPSLLPEFAGKINLIYIDPPFDTGADFSFTATVPEGPKGDGDDSLRFTKEPRLSSRRQIVTSGEVHKHISMHGSGGSTTP